jgi:hypothetical protein
MYIYMSYRTANLQTLNFKYLLSGRGLCDELITLPEESYRLWCVVVCVMYKPH